MCGIVGTPGTGPASRSSSTACAISSTAATTRPASPCCRRRRHRRGAPVGNLDALIAAAGNGDSTAVVGLGHTRWATHGRPSHDNAHPHVDCTRPRADRAERHHRELQELRAELCRGGHTFTSETDAEVVAHLIEAALAERPGRRGARHRARASRQLRVLRRVGRRAAPDRRHAPRGAARRRAGRREPSSPRTIPAFSGPHAPGGRARRRRRRRCSTADGVAVTDRAGAAVEREARRGHLGRRRRREGRLRDVHDQGDPRAAAGPAPTRSPGG